MEEIIGVITRILHSDEDISYIEFNTANKNRYNLKLGECKIIQGGKDEKR